MVALEGKVAFVEFGEEWHLTELTGGDSFLEVFAAQLVFKILFAVDDVLALLWADDEADVIPFTSWFCGI